MSSPVDTSATLSTSPITGFSSASTEWMEQSVIEKMPSSDAAAPKARPHKQRAPKKAPQPAADKPEASSNQPTSSAEDVDESFVDDALRILDTKFGIKLDKSGSSELDNIIKSLISATLLAAKERDAKRIAAEQKAILVAKATLGNVSKDLAKAREQLLEATLAGEDAETVALKEKVHTLTAKVEKLTALLRDASSSDTARQNNPTHSGKSGKFDKLGKSGNKSEDAPQNHMKFHPSGVEQASGAQGTSNGKSSGKSSRSGKSGNAANSGNPNASVAQLPPTEVDAVRGNESGAPNSKLSRKSETRQKRRPRGDKHAGGAQDAQEGADAVESTVGDDGRQ